VFEYTRDHVAEVAAGWLSILDTAEKPFSEHTLR
jgi:hypothetical protein